MGLRGMFNELGDGKEEQSSLAGEKGGSEKDWFWWEHENWRRGEQQFAQDGRTEANRSWKREILNIWHGRKKGVTEREVMESRYLHIEDIGEIPVWSVEEMQELGKREDDSGYQKTNLRWQMFSNWRMENYLTRKLEELRIVKTNLQRGKTALAGKVSKAEQVENEQIIEIEGERKKEMWKKRGETNTDKYQWPGNCGKTEWQSIRKKKTLSMKLKDTQSLFKRRNTVSEI